MADLKLLTIDDVARALDFITDYDNRETWVQMAMALKSEFGEAGFDVWDTWSQRSDLYKASDARSVWKSVKASGRLGIGTLIKRAKENGFKFSVRELSQEERDRRTAEAIERKRINKQRREADAKAHKQRQQTAAQRATEIWPKLPEEGHSPYLARKKIHGFGCRYGKNGSIAIPLWKAGKLTGLQWIDAEGGKKFLTGTEKSGAVFTINAGGTGQTILCEGYATGCSIATALPNARVVVCFDAGNLVTVARLFNQTDIVVAADNDHHKPENKGLQVARDIVAAHPSALAVWPGFPVDDSGTDFNDLHCTQGIDAVRLVLTAAVAQPFPDSVVNTMDRPPAPEKPPAGGEGGGLDHDWQSRLARSKSDKDGRPGQILGWSSNIALIFEHDSTFKGGLSYCDFSYRIIKRRELLPQVTVGEWTDSDTSAAMIWMARKYGFEPSDPKMAHALVNVAKHNRFHPVRDYLENLHWDGTERLHNWLADIYESPAPADYLAAAGKKFLIGSVARIFKPGCKMDNVMILEGAQGLRKSTSVHTLFGDWFSDAPIPLGDKDSYQNIQGVWCHELAELDSFNKAESTTAKNFFTQTRDRFRPSYGHRAEDFPRQTVFVGTTNQDEYLKDYTGNRRYWPVKCSIVNLDVITANRDQYWAEAVHWFKKGVPWWITSESERQLFEAEQDSRLQIDPWQYPIEDHLRSMSSSYVTSAELLGEAIKKDAAHVTKADQNRISPIMKALGWQHKKKRVQVGNEKLPRWVYVRP